MSTPRKVKVVIAANNVVYVDGAGYGPGEEVAVTAAEAKALVAEGRAEKVR